MNDHRSQRSPDSRQLVLATTMGVALAIIFAVALGSWIFALVGFAAGLAIYGAIPLFRR